MKATRIAETFVGEVTEFKIGIDSVKAQRDEIARLFLKHKVLIF